MRPFLAALLAAATLAVPARAQPPVWVASDADSEVVIFGSVHVLPPGLDWRPKVLDAALADAQDLWFELPAGAAVEAEVARLAVERGVLPPGQSLYRLLPPDDVALLLKVAKAYGVEPATLDRLEPWLAEVALAGSAYRKAGAATEHGVEATISAAAPEPIRREAFETPAQQIHIFDSAPLPEQLASLRETLRELDRDPEAYVKMVRAWMDGDVRGLDEEALEPLRKASPGVFQRLVADRNARWTEILDLRLKGRGKTVVVVGVGHLVGDGGLPARLRALGYSVTGP